MFDIMSGGKSAQHLVDYAPSKKTFIETYDYDLKAILLIFMLSFLLFLK